MPHAQIAEGFDPNDPAMQEIIAQAEALHGGEFPITNPTVAAPPQGLDLVTQLLELLGQNQQGRANTGLDLIDALEGIRGQNVDINQGLLTNLQGEQQRQQDTRGNLLATLTGSRQVGGGQLQQLLGLLQSSRLGGGQLAQSGLATLGANNANQAAAGTNLFNAFAGERASRRAGATGQFSAIGADRASRGGRAQALFSDLLTRELAANANPIGILDQLSLASQFGTVAPLSAAGSTELSKFGLKPGSLTGDLQETIRSLLEESPEQGQLTQIVMDLLQESPELAQLFQDIQGRVNAEPDEGLLDALRQALTPGVGEQQVANLAVNATQMSQQERDLLDAIQAGNQRTPEQQALIDAIMGQAEPDPRVDTAADTIAAFAQDAIPRGTVHSVFRDDAGNLQAFVILPDGSAEFLNMGNIRDIFGLGALDAPPDIQQQGRGGTFNIGRADLGRALESRVGRTEAFNERTNLLGDDGQAVRDARGRERTLRIQNLQRISDDFRTAGPSGSDQFNQLVQEIEGLPSFAHGGSTVIDRPSLIIDAQTGQPTAMLAENEPEVVDIRPASQLASLASGESGGSRPTNLRRDVGFRFDQIRERDPQTTVERALEIARAPGEFEEETAPLTIASRLLGSGLAEDRRFRDPFVKALALGERPAPNDLNAREFQDLPIPLRNALEGIVGPQLFTAWLEELLSQTPQGTQVRANRVSSLRVA